MSWPAASDNVGVTAYDLQRRTGTGAWTALSLASALSLGADVPLAPGASVYTFRVRARDVAGNASAWMTGPAFTLTLSQENAKTIKYTGAWSRVKLTGASGAWVDDAKAKGRKASSASPARASPSSPAWVPTGARRPSGWMASRSPVSISMPRSRALPGCPSPHSAAPGSHTLEIRLTGTKNAKSSGSRVDVDAFLVLT